MRRLPPGRRRSWGRRDGDDVVCMHMPVEKSCGEFSCRLSVQARYHYNWRTISCADASKGAPQQNDDPRAPFLVESSIFGPLFEGADIPQSPVAQRPFYQFWGFTGQVTCPLSLGVIQSVRAHVEGEGAFGIGRGSRPLFGICQRHHFGVAVPTSPVYAIGFTQRESSMAP
jgi:hypothetical protein